MYLPNLTANPQFKALNSFQKSMYVVFAWRADTKGFMFTSYSTLAEDCGISERTVKRNMPGLIQTGLVKVLSLGNSNNKASTYQVVILGTPKKQDSASASQAPTEEIGKRLTGTGDSQSWGNCLSGTYASAPQAPTLVTDRPTKSIPLRGPIQEFPIREESIIINNEKMDRTINSPLTGSALDAGLDWDPQVTMAESRKRMMEKNRREEDRRKLDIAFETWNIDKCDIESFIDKCYSSGIKDPFTHFSNEMDKAYEARQKNPPSINFKQ